MWYWCDFRLAIYCIFSKKTVKINENQIKNEFAFLKLLAYNETCTLFM